VLQGHCTTYRSGRSSVEINTWLFCASAPCVRLLLRRMAPGIMSSLSGISRPNGRSTVPHKSSTHTHLSARRGAPLEAFELHSRGEHDFGDSQAANTSMAYWSSSKDQIDRRSEVTDDDDSQKGVLPVQKTEILKTVSIWVTDPDGERSLSHEVGHNCKECRHFRSCVEHP
jgi:hypothetical protein